MVESGNVVDQSLIKPIKEKTAKNEGNMNLHEHQAKALFREFSIPVPEGDAAFSVAEAVSVANLLGGDKWIVKAQVHAGGRGKAGEICEEAHETRRTLGAGRAASHPKS